MSREHKPVAGKATDSFRQRMDWLHLWGGLVCGWLLCAIFVAGTLSVFRAPITRWMQAAPPLPQHGAPAAADVSDAALRSLLAHLQAQAPEADAWSLMLPAAPGDAVQLSWRDTEGNSTQRAADPVDGQLLAAPWGRQSEGGRHFMLLHYMLHAGMTGFWVVGVVGMAGLVALVSGVVVHKRIFKDFFTFRPGKGQRSWLDAHNASAVLCLPFLAMIIYTGLAYFYTSYMPLPLRAVYGAQEGAYQRFSNELTGSQADSTASTVALAVAADTGTAILQLRQQALVRTGSPVQRIFIRHPGRTDMVVRMMGATPDGVSADAIHRQSGLLVFAQARGGIVELVRAGAPPRFTSAAVHPVLEQLHVAGFGGWGMKWLYFFGGLLGSLVIATGLQLFTVKRRQKSLHEFGRATPQVYRAIDILNIAAIVGSCVASIGFLYANRFIAAQTPERANLEIRAFFLIWLGCLLHAALRPSGPAWREQTACLALLCLGLPLLNWATTGQHVLVYLGAGDWQRASVELVALGLGAAALLVLPRLGRRVA